MSRKQYDYETVWLCTTTQGSVLRHSKDDNGEDACRGNGFISIVEYCMVTVIAVSRTISVCSCVLQQRTTKMCDRNTRKPRKFKQTNGRLRSFRGVLGPGSDMSEERMTTLLSQLFIFFFYHFWGLFSRQVQHTSDCLFFRIWSPDVTLQFWEGEATAQAHTGTAAPSWRNQEQGNQPLVSFGHSNSHYKPVLFRCSQLQM